MLIHRVGGQDAGEVIKVRPRTWGRAVACLGCGAKAACAHSYCKRTVADVPPTRVAAPGASRRINNTLPIGSPKRLQGYQERIGAGLVPVGMGVLAGIQLMSPAWRERLRVRAAHYGATSVPGSKVSFDGGAWAGLHRCRVDLSWRSMRLPWINSLPSAWPRYGLLRPRHMAGSRQGTQTAQGGGECVGHPRTCRAPYAEAFGCAKSVITVAR